MKRTLLSLIALGLGILAAAQGNRIVCDETCRIEYQKTGTEQPEQAAAPKTEGKKAAAKPAPKTAAKAQSAPVPGYAVVSPVGRTSVEMNGCHPSGNQAPHPLALSHGRGPAAG